MFFLGGLISDRNRSNFRNNDPAHAAPPEAGRTTTPKRGAKVPKDVQGLKLSKAGRKAKKSK